MTERKQNQPQSEESKEYFGSDWVWRSNAYHDLKAYLAREKGIRSNSHEIPTDLMKILYTLVGLTNYLSLKSSDWDDSQTTKQEALKCLPDVLRSSVRKIRHGETSHDRGKVEKRHPTEEEVIEMETYIRSYLIQQGFVSDEAT